MYLQPTSLHWACDIEADGLLEDVTTIHCVCVENVETGEQHAFTNKKDFHRWIKPDYIFVGHNFIAYDVVVLNRLWKTNIPARKVVDTFVLSQLYTPTYTGGHSLEAWGQRLRFPKGSFNEWSKFSPEMLAYCRNDASLTARLFTRLTERMRTVGFTETGAEIEHLAWNIIQNKQRRHGFPFNKQKAEELYASLRHKENALKEEIFKVFPPKYTCVASFARRCRKDGTPTENYKRHSQQYPELRSRPDGGYDAYDWVEFNLGSPSQRVEKLLEAGWTPVSFTPVTDKGGGGNPKVDEESLISFAETVSGDKAEAGKLIAKWLVLNSRANMIRTWLDAYNEKTGAIHGKVFIASTLRYRHTSPNTANIPAVRVNKDKGVLYGEAGTWAYECRDLFYAGKPDFRLVGIDAKGIQLRILCNYAYSEEFLGQVLAGDPHTNNIKTLGLANKAAAKKFLYTTLMGGQGKRLAADQAAFGTKLTEAQGRALRQKLIDSVPGFNDLIKRLEKELAKTGRIKLCDGTPILVPSPHMVIPYLLQGDESRIMKKASILLDTEIRKHGLRAFKVGDIHDEWQFVVANEDVSRFTELALGVFPITGRFFNYRVPIEGDAKCGLTWAETH